MWTCPKCGREFRQTNQDHHCGKASISMAACKKDSSFYVDAETIAYFLQQTTFLSAKKNAIYFPYEKELPVETITNTVKYFFQSKKEAGI